ncbi:tyrosine-protein phosphatase non-receptor type substrate 1-like [Spea bombifrons]|uniref:tyrosine-protein phosphatase non-receptor type substrate 1-like n=1 Tax=Spea bombifrons TaxID=233779 RepID=UPI00234B5376|nr:tyrosine-protein phosphatase non-receptor type substrate 1-like [Spea bombifrons]
MDKEKQLLICEAQRFYPPELNISWSFSNMENQTQDTLVENVDGTYTKRSTVGIADIMREREVTCSLQHISLTAPLNDTLYVSDPSPVRYHYLFLLLLILTVLFVVFVYRRHRSRRNGSSPATRETRARKRTREQQPAQDGDGDSDVHYASIFHGGGETQRQLPRKRVTEEESVEYAAVKIAAAITPDATAYGQNMEEPFLSYATLRISPPQTDITAVVHREPGHQHPEQTYARVQCR